MSLVARLFPERRSVSYQDVWGRGLDVSAGSKSGVNVTFDSLMGLAVAWRCITLIADQVSALPVDVFRKDSAGTRVEVSSPSSLVVDPSVLVGAEEWRYQAAVSLGAFGNAYALVNSRDRFGFVSAAEVIDPGLVKIERSSQLERPRYRVNGSLVADDEMLHVRKWLRPGAVEGMSPLDRHQETVGLAVAVRDYVSEWFGQGAHPSSILTTEHPLTGEKDAKTAKERFKAAVDGREPVVLGQGWDVRQVQESPADSEVGEIGHASTVAIANIFSVPPEWVGVGVEGSSVTYANREQRSIDFLTFTLAHWLSTFEKFYDRELPRGQFTKFNTAALLRMDALTQANVFEKGLRAGYLSQNDVRQLLDRPPIDDGDQYLWPPFSTTDGDENVDGSA